MKLKQLTLACSIAALLGAPLTTLADSDLDVGAAGTAAATANLDFELTIPSFVFFQVGATSSIDTVQIVLDGTTEAPGSTVAVAQSGPAVNVILRSNAPSVVIDADGSADPLDDGGTTIPWSQIIADNSGGTGLINPPVIGGADTTVPASGGVINLSDQWQYSFANSTVYPEGFYQGSVVFTATTL